MARTSTTGWLELGLPDEALAVVLSSWVLSYLEADRRRAFVARIEQVAQHRDVTLLYQEQPQLVDGLPGASRQDSPEGPTALVPVDWREGRARDPIRQADMHPHGRWIEWLAGT